MSIQKIFSLLLLLCNFCLYANYPCSTVDLIKPVELYDYGQKIGTFSVNLGYSKQQISQGLGLRKKIFYDCREAGLVGKYGGCIEYTVAPNSKNVTNLNPKGKKIEQLMAFPGVIRIIVGPKDKNGYANYAYSMDHYQSFCHHPENKLKL